MRIFLIISRTLLLALFVQAILLGMAKILNWPEKTVAVCALGYVALFFMLYVPNRFFYLRTLWDNISQHATRKQKNLLIMLKTAIIFAVSSPILGWQNMLPIELRISFVAIITSQCALIFSLLYYSNKRFLQRFWNFMIAKPNI